MLRRNHQSRQPRRSRKYAVERLEQRRMMAADTLGVTPMDTGEFLLGSVGVTPVLLESDGSIDTETQDWTAEEIDAVLANVRDGVNWWSDMLDTLDTVHTLDFTIDETFARTPYETSYEPIDRSSADFHRWVGEFVIDQGYGDARTIEEAVQAFNHDQRIRLGTDWAFTIFVVDSSDDDDGFFAGNSFKGAFAFAGGLFYVLPSSRPVATYAHEMGHIFWARDEYAGGGSWSDTRGYYDAQNLNAYDNPTPGFQQEVSIMRGGVPLQSAYRDYLSPESTLAQVGWRDSDGDGIFDLADVPLHLEGEGYFDSATSIYHFQGFASAVPLRNQNSSGPQSDITFNRIGELQYRLDDGSWVTAASPDAQVVDFDEAVSITTPFETIQWRVIDLTTGVTSPVMSGTVSQPAISQAAIRGFAYLDQNLNGTREENEQLLSSTQFVLSHTDGTPLFAGRVDAEQQPDGELHNLDGVQLAAVGSLTGANVAAFAADELANRRVLHAWDQQRERWIPRWSSEVQLEATFDQPVGEVSLEAFGVGASSYARVEAYDAEGNLIQRSTSAALADGQPVTVTVKDPAASIASIRAFGHANTSVSFAAIEFGSDAIVTTDATGAFRFENLADGDYQVLVMAADQTTQFSGQPFEITVVNGSSSLIAAAATMSGNPWHNEGLPQDVNRDGDVTARDALLVINDLGRNDTRELTENDDSPFALDVNDDGNASALDALLVINYLGRADQATGEAESAEDYRQGETAAVIQFDASAALASTFSLQQMSSSLHGTGSAEAESVAPLSGAFSLLAGDGPVYSKNDSPGWRGCAAGGVPGDLHGRVFAEATEAEWLDPAFQLEFLEPFAQSKI